ncbi:MAG: hypothetical protein SV422_05490 [Pseudomonadota bacterium]|nr:hypothetical protein [Pseudomonadota bacterium]
MKPLLLVPLLLLLTACASMSPPQNTGNVCSIFEQRRNWFEAAKRSEERWGVPIPVTMAFIRHESGFYGKARPARKKILWVIPGPRPSNAYGYAQALNSTWRDYERSVGKSGSRSNFADAVDFIGWYNNMSYRMNDIERGDAFNLYLAYHEGNTGFARRTYANKKWLIDVANSVQANKNVYERQYAGCERDLNRNWYERLFSFFTARIRTVRA